jgi:Amt family ammonium transporter
MFAATAATIVSGAVAERVKLGAFLLFSAVYVAVVYPIVGSWKWGGGWLATMGDGANTNFHDFAGSTLVHSVGGWGALAGIIVLGPRLGKFVRGTDGRPVTRPIMGHSMPLATIGALLLWFGWFGFNGGSVLSADPMAVSYVFVTTSLAAAAGIFGAMIASRFIQKKPDLSMVLNGMLAGLVGITAGADVVSVRSAVLIGAIAGVLVVVAVVLLDRVRLDDPVGAVSVHLVCGIWGTLAVGIFVPEKSFVAQAIGVGAAGAACFPAALALFWVIRQDHRPAGLTRGGTPGPRHRRARHGGLRPDGLARLHGGVEGFDGGGRPRVPEAGAERELTPEHGVAAPKWRGGDPGRTSHEENRSNHQTV